VLPQRKETWQVVAAGTKIYITLPRKGVVQVVYYLVRVAEEFMIPELRDTIVHFFLCNVCQTANYSESDTERILLHGPVQV